ncbi:MAG TPA: matrixin family metalloprotease, partial [Pyrinomonadaceae bacterium]|nr:matrixin family metalloprotease [Pyrinomonadaceae bacterium]
MRRYVSILLLFALTFWPVVPARAYTLQYTNANANVQIRWPATTITVALSNSLNSPPANIKAGSDVVGAARRALSRWAEASNIEFVVTTSAAGAIGNDGVNLITVSTENAGLFNCGADPAATPPQGRARVTFDPNTGGIVDGDVAINPNSCAQFSTDGTPGTFDLEATFVHEIGHMLGLEHSGVVAASMQPRQGRNGIYDLPALTVRTLSDDDIAGIRAIYGPLSNLGAIQGTVAGPSGAIFGAHVFAEEVSTGRVRGSNITLPDGRYRIDGLPAGQYRVVVEPLDEPVRAGEIASRSGAYQGLQNQTPLFRTFEVGTFNVASDSTTNVSPVLTSALQPALNPRFVGINSQLSSIPAPLVPGQTRTVFVGGNNLHQVEAGGISFNSNFITLNPASLQKMVFTASNGEQVQVLSFDVTLSILTPPGDYSIRLLSTLNELAYVAGGLTVDLPFGSTLSTPNPIDNTTFFVAQHYRDFFNREPDAPGLAFWVNQIEECGANVGCREVRTVNVSAAFFQSIEFQQTGDAVYRFYEASFNRRPLISEFLPDAQRIQRGVIVGQGNWEAQLEANRQAYA